MGATSCQNVSWLVVVDGELEPPHAAAPRGASRNRIRDGLVIMRGLREGGRSITCQNEHRTRVFPSPPEEKCFPAIRITHRRRCHRPARRSLDRGHLDATIGEQRQE